MRFLSLHKTRVCGIISHLTFPTKIICKSGWMPHLLTKQPAPGDHLLSSIKPQTRLQAAAAWETFLIMTDAWKLAGAGWGKISEVPALIFIQNTPCSDTLLMN